MITVRRFTPSDWYGWAGAESWTNNQPPFISYGELYVAEWPERIGPTFSGKITVIADAEGIHLHGDNGYAVLSLKATPELAKIFASSLPNPTNVTQLRKMGFTFSNFPDNIDYRLNFEI